jgi:hypothetical protein
VSSRARKRARAAAAGEVRIEAAPEPPSRSELKNVAARAELEPLAEGERPTAVTVAAIATSVLLVANIVVAVLGNGLPGVSGSSKVAPTIVYTLLFGAMAWGLWQASYWAVLGLQALLAITMMYAGLGLLVASNVLTALLAIVTLAAAGTLFWFLIRAMARIQMPDRR